MSPQSIRQRAFVEACRARVPGADVRVGVGERLPLALGEFDVVLAQLVTQPLNAGDQSQVLQLRRVELVRQVVDVGGQRPDPGREPSQTCHHLGGRGPIATWPKIAAPSIGGARY